MYQERITCYQRFENWFVYISVYFLSPIVYSLFYPIQHVHVYVQPPIPSGDLSACEAS